MLSMRQLNSILVEFPPTAICFDRTAAFLTLPVTPIEYSGEIFSFCDNTHAPAASLTQFKVKLQPSKSSEKNTSLTLLTIIFTSALADCPLESVTIKIGRASRRER